jgi:hypothetical protein
MKRVPSDSIEHENLESSQLTSKEFVIKWNAVAGAGIEEFSVIDYDK